MMNLRHACLSLLTGTALLASCSGGDKKEHPHIVVITLDTTRADHLSTYGYERLTDPHLRRLAEESRVFEMAYPTATWTLPSHVSMFSGLDPVEHGCWMTVEHAEELGEAMPSVSKSLPLITGSLRRSGYHLIAAVGGPFTSERYGLLRDFDSYLDPGEEWELHSSRINAWLREAIAARPVDEPLFLFVNYFDAHAPYDPPAGIDYPFSDREPALPAIPPLRKYLRAEGRAQVSASVLADALEQYDREIYVQDRAMGELLGMLEEAGILDEALLIVTADHGEMFGEHKGVYGHGGQPFEPVARVPLVVRAPRGPVDRVEVPVSNASIASTIAGFADVAFAAGSLARMRLPDLLDPTLGQGEGSDFPVFIEARSAKNWLAVFRKGQQRYGVLFDPESNGRTINRIVVGDLPTIPPSAASPGALTIVTPDEIGDDEDLRAILRMVRAYTARWIEPPEDVSLTPLSDEDVRRLKQLGY